MFFSYRFVFEGRCVQRALVVQTVGALTVDSLIYRLEGAGRRASACLMRESHSCRKTDASEPWRVRVPLFSRVPLSFGTLAPTLSPRQIGRLGA